MVWILTCWFWCWCSCCTMDFVLLLSTILSLSPIILGGVFSLSVFCSINVSLFQDCFWINKSPSSSKMFSSFEVIQDRKEKEWCDMYSRQKKYYSKQDKYVFEFLFPSKGINTRLQLTFLWGKSQKKCKHM